MRKYIALVLALVCVLGLVGCGQSKQVPPEVDLDAPFNECWPGTITDIFTEGSGADLAEVIKLEIKNYDPMYFTIVEDTEYLRYYSDTGETEEITKEDLYVGAWVEIDCESYHNSGYHPIFTIKVIEPNKPTTEESADIGAELMVDPVAPVTIQNIFTGEKASITSNEDIRTISNLLFSDLWNTEGTADCANNIEITINGEIYNYHSDCGTFNDNIKQQSLSLDDTTKENVNVMIAEYISLTATEIIVE